MLCQSSNDGWHALKGRAGLLPFQVPHQLDQIDEALGCKSRSVACVIRPASPIFQESCYSAIDPPAKVSIIRPSFPPRFPLGRKLIARQPVEFFA